MDNVNYNFVIVEKLFEQKKENNTFENHLNKPIIVIIVSIIECILYDFIRRVQQHTREIIPGIDQISIDDTKKKSIDELEPLIAHAKKKKYLLDQNQIYEDLDYLRKIRNRIHIQNRHQHLDKDEYKIWTDCNVRTATNCLEYICEILSTVYPRPNTKIISMSDFPRPWKKIHSSRA